MPKSSRNTWFEVFCPERCYTIACIDVIKNGRCKNSEQGERYMKKAILFYNPISGDHGVAQRLDHIIGRFQERDILLQPYRLKSDSFNLIPDVIERGDYDFVVASGGDGTLNYIANVILKNFSKLPFGIIPAGTCNDFARSLRIPYSLDECLNIILNGKTYEVDAGLINEETYFLSTYAGGFFVEVSYNTDNELKRNFGPFAYYLKALSEVVNLKNFKVKITTETDVVETKALMFLVLNGKDVGGFSDVIREADVSDGYMDILIIKNCSHIDLGNMFFKVLSRDSLNDRRVAKLRAKKCLIECSSDIAVSMDGEKGPELPASIRFINKALKVFVK